jgi:thiamine pyrophosphate-dependent acetolactate synthase large subunit-like protein
MCTHKCLDVPWINTQCKPAKTAKIFHIDVDPLKRQMPVFYLNCVARYFADSYESISQLTNYLSSSSLSQLLSSQEFAKKWDLLGEAHSKRLAAIAAASEPKPDNTFGTGYLCRTLRKLVPVDTIWAIEAVTNTAFVADNIQATFPGSWINCGGGGLGWSGGGTLGIKLATEYENGPGKGKFVVQIVGDGTFLFSVPGSVYWISRRYKIPVLTIVLNNKGIPKGIRLLEILN